MRVCVFTLAALGLSACTCVPASAQLSNKTALYYGAGSDGVDVLACFALQVQVTWPNTLAKYVTALQTGTYDLVVLEIAHPLFYIPAAEKPVLIGLFEDHLAKGGALLVNYPDLDSWPQLAELCGAVVTKDRGQDQGTIGPASPHHPAWLFTVTSLFPIVTIWPDHGDELGLLAGSQTVSTWDDFLAPSSVVHADEKRIINAFDWDQFDSGAAIIMAQLEVRYLVGCRADLDFNGQLTVNDFLEFQNLFDFQHPFANFDFGPTFDFFDYLGFINKFVNGCD